MCILSKSRETEVILLAFLAEQTEMMGIMMGIIKTYGPISGLLSAFHHLVG